MRLERLDARGDGGVERAVAHLRGLIPSAADVSARVAEIVADVRDGGDDALLRHVRELDCGGADPPPLLLDDPAALAAEFNGLPAELRTALDLAYENISEVGRAWHMPPRTVSLPQGHSVALREVPVGRAAVYVPGGRAPYVSSVLMGVATARAAGVDGSVVVACPPTHAGDVHPAIKAACSLGGATLLRAGGAHAIAALAHGTESVAPADVIVGPGNLWVQEAKRQVSGHVGIDSFAGPSDVLCICDPDADPRLVAADLLAQAEHGAASIAVAVSWDEGWLDALADGLELAAGSPAPDGPVVLVQAAAAEACAFADAFAPEHLQLFGAGAERLAPIVANAGCVFVGPGAGTAFGDYVAGSNHCLPTGGASRFASGLNPGHFLRRRAEVRIPPDAAAALAQAGAVIARAEGFERHAESMEARIRENGGRP